MVRIRTDSIEVFLAESKMCKTFCFGAGEHFENIMKRLSKNGVYKLLCAVVDNDKNKWGKKKQFKDKEYEIISFQTLCNIAKTEKVLILITNYKYFNDLIFQMDQEKILNGVSVYIGELLTVPIVTYPDFTIIDWSKHIIPKTIHYCWFGKKEIPQEYLNCMKTWKKYCPNYEMVLWNENNYDVRKNKYMSDAYDNEKWAFVSDYARIDIIYHMGGIYLDCDVELIKPLDNLLGTEMYCGFEDYKYINLGLGYGAVAGHPYLKALLEYYDELNFYDIDGKINLIACPYHQTKVAEKFGIVAKNSYQHVEGITVYPSEVLAPFSYWGLGEITKHTYSIHHFGDSWHDKEEKILFAEWKKNLKILFDRLQLQKENI